MGLLVDTVFVWVTDLAGSVEWYRSLGLASGPRFGPWQSLATAGETRFALHEGVREPGIATAVISFRVDDLDAELSRLAGLGIVPSDSEVTDTGEARFITFIDPDGNEIQLLER